MDSAQAKSSRLPKVQEAGLEQETQIKTMKTKLFGIALILLGLITLGWIALQVLIVKGMQAAIYGVIPLVAGWLIFNYASKEESPKEKQPVEAEIKSGFGRIRSFLKGLL